MKSLRWLLPLIIIAAVGYGTMRWYEGRAGSTAPTGTFRLGFEVETTSLDPIKVSDAYASRVIGQIFEGLVTLNEKNEVIPALAESWSSEQAGKAWVFTLRKDAKFHEHAIFGDKKTRSVDAEDVAFSFTRCLSKDSSVSYAIAGVLQGAEDFSNGKAQQISGIRVLDSQHVAFDLLTPDPLFPKRLSSVILAVVPREAAKLPAGQVFGRDVTIGSGPFRVVRRTDTEVELEKNAAYWQTVPGNVQRIVFNVIKNDALRLAAARNGEQDAVYVPALLASSLAGEKDGAYMLKSSSTGATLTVHRTFNSTFLGLNCERLDVPARRALNLATDRTALAKFFLAGTVSPTVGPVPLAIAGYSEPVPANKPAETEQARAAFAQSAWPKDKPLEILVHEKEASEQMGQLLQAQFAAAGIKTNITKLEYGAVLGRMVKGDYDAFFMSFEYVYSTPMPIIDGLMNSKRIPSPNFWRYSNSAVDAALAEFSQATDSDAANKIAAKIVGIAQDDPPSVYLYQTLTPVIQQKRVQNLTINGHSVPMLWRVTLSP